MSRLRFFIPACIAVSALAPAAPCAQSPGGAAYTPAPAPFFLNKPHISLGSGSLYYHEHDFETAPGLDSHYREPVFDMSLGWDFILMGRHGLTLDFDFFQTPEDVESWKEDGALVQENDLTVGRFGVEIGYLGSTWNRALPPQDLGGVDRYFRFAGGIGIFYRRQAFLRDDFIDFTMDPAVRIDADVEETFDMFGAEAIVELEAGPRHIAAAFIRGRVGGSAVVVQNDGLEPVIDEEDARISTAGVHGTLEAGVVSQFLRNVELRLGYRYHRQEVFEEKTTASGFDPIEGPVTFLIELPDNTTEIHMVFFEAAFMF